jgi:hypothetical protein
VIVVSSPPACIAPRVRGERERCSEPRAPGSLFCSEHEKAPIGVRGGWVSAEKRRRKLVAAHGDDLDYRPSSITRNLWIGALPPTERDLPSFDAIALCAAEYQLDMPAYHGQIIRCPVRNAELDLRELRIVLSTAQLVARALSNRRRVLVTCMAGINRAPLVASLALSQLTRLSAEELVGLMRQRRNPYALCNESFRGVLERFVGAGTRRGAGGSKPWRAG